MYTKLAKLSPKLAKYGRVHQTRQNRVKSWQIHFEKKIKNKNFKKNKFIEKFPEIGVFGEHDHI